MTIMRKSTALALLGLALLLLFVVSCARQGAPGPEEGAGNQSREQREAPAQTTAGEESTGPAEAAAREEGVAEEVAPRRSCQSLCYNCVRMSSTAPRRRAGGRV